MPPSGRRGSRSSSLSLGSDSVGEIEGFADQFRQFNEPQLRIVPGGPEDGASSPMASRSRSVRKLLGKGVSERLLGTHPRDSGRLLYCKVFAQPTQSEHAVTTPRWGPFSKFPPIVPRVEPASPPFLIGAFTEPLVDLNTLTFLLPLEGTRLRKVDDWSFVITQPDGEAFTISADTEEAIQYWMRTLSNLCLGNSSHGNRLPDLKKMALVAFKMNLSESAVLRPLSKKKKRTAFVGGTLDDVVEFVLFHCVSNQELGRWGLSPTEVLLCGHPAFTSAPDLLNAILAGIDRHSMSAPERLKRTWVERFYEFADQVSASQSLAPQLKVQVVDKCHKLVDGGNSVNLRSNLAATTSHNVDLSDMENAPVNVAVNPKWETESKELSLNERLLKESSLSLAQQLTIIEANYHLQIDVEELVVDRGSGHVQRMTDWWNKVCGWVATLILQQNGPKAQARVIRKFIKITSMLVELRNYSTASQILTGLQHTTIDRLKGFHEFLSPKATATLRKLKEMFSPSDNYKEYRNLSFESPCLRFMAVHQRDLRFILDGNSTFLDDAKTIINFEKSMMISSSLWSLGALSRPQSFLYSQLIKDDTIYALFSKISRLHDDQLFSLSFLTEACRAQEARPTGDGENRVQNPLFGLDRSRLLKASLTTQSGSVSAPTLL